MTEEEWLASTDTAAMLRLYTTDEMPWPRGTPAPMVSERKLRLFACACHHASGLQPTPAYNFMEKDGERFIDNFGIEGGDAVYLARVWANPTRQQFRPDIPQTQKAALLRDIIGNPWRPVPRLWHECPGCWDDSQFFASGMCRTCDGKGRYQLSPWLTWNNGTVHKIAASIYADRSFELMPILADMLEDAGCTDVAILRHCRGQELIPNPTTGNPPLCFYGPLRGPHVRGCHVIDILTGRS